MTSTNFSDFGDFGVSFTAAVKLELNTLSSNIIYVQKRGLINPVFELLPETRAMLLLLSDYIGKDAILATTLCQYA